MSTDDETLVLSGTMAEHRAYTPWWSGLVRRLEEMVNLLPTYRDTNRGRRNAQQIRLLILVLGVAVIAFGGIRLIVLGAVTMALALVVPLSELQARSWKGKLRRLRTSQTRTTQVEVELVYDGRRVLVRKEGKTLRRVLLRGGEHVVVPVRAGAETYLAIRPASGRRADSIWLRTDSHAWDRDQQAEQLSADAVDAPVRIKAEDLVTLRRRLGTNPRIGE